MKESKKSSTSQMFFRLHGSPYTHTLIFMGKTEHRATLSPYRFMLLAEPMV